MKQKIYPIVFSCDENYAKYLGVAITSIYKNRKPNNSYKIFILNTDLSFDTKQKLKSLSDRNFLIEFVCVEDRMKNISRDKIHLRDYYTQAIYYRIFIPSLFPDYQKILYVDCDVVFDVDVANIFENDLGDTIFGVVNDEVVPAVKEFYEYVEGFLGVDRNRYFNSGLLLINCEQFNKFNVEKKFIDLMNKFKLEVAPDQDYLNLICKDKVTYLDLGWNKNPIPNANFDDKNVKMVHYKMSYKPWRYNDVMYSDIYWKYARISPFYLEIMFEKESFTDEDRAREMQKGSNLLQLAKNYLQNGKLEIV